MRSGRQLEVMKIAAELFDETGIGPIDVHLGATWIISSCTPPTGAPSSAARSRRRHGVEGHGEARHPTARRRRVLTWRTLRKEFRGP